jgi:hypothetical protein
LAAGFGSRAAGGRAAAGGLALVVSAAAWGDPGPARARTKNRVVSIEEGHCRVDATPVGLGPDPEVTAPAELAGGDR